MSVSFKKFPGEPIILQTLHADHSYKLEGQQSLTQMANLLDEQSVPTFYVMDLTEATLSFDDIMSGSSLATKQMATFKHPMIREILIVTNSQMLSMAARGLATPVFGNLNIKVFETTDEALDYARKSK